VQRANQKKEKDQGRTLSMFKNFDNEDRAYWIVYYKIDITKINVFEQIRLFVLTRFRDKDFYQDPENIKIEYEYRFYKDGEFDMEFTSEYFKLELYKPLDETWKDLKNALTRVNDKYITRCNLLSRHATFYHQRWSWFF
jgi:hypothetical protein